VVVTGAGHEQRNVDWAEARGRWDVASGLKDQAQLDELIAFFRARKGKAYGFRFKDWTDYKATDQLIGTGDGAIKTFQLVKRYPSGSVIEVRTITKPVAGTVDLRGRRGATLGVVGRCDERRGHLRDGTGCGGGDHRRLRVRRAGAVRHRPHGGHHREVPPAPLAADPRLSSSGFDPPEQGWPPALKWTSEVTGRRLELLGRKAAQRRKSRGSYNRDAW
jgi:Conserved hypothetical protein 2217 (DUF2460)